MNNEFDEELDTIKDSIPPVDEIIDFITDLFEKSGLSEQDFYNRIQKIVFNIIGEDDEEVDAFKNADLDYLIGTIFGYYIGIQIESNETGNPYETFKAVITDAIMENFDA